MSNHDRGSPDGNTQRFGPDDTLGRAWRAASDEQPAAQLDAAILSAARHSAADRGVEPAAKFNAVPAVRVRAPSAFRRWQPLAVAASVAGVAFILVQTVPREPDFSPSMETQKSVSSPATSPPTQPPVQVDANEVSTSASTSTSAPVPAPASTSAPAARVSDQLQPRTEARDMAQTSAAFAAPPLEPAPSAPMAEAAASSRGAAAESDMAAVVAPARDNMASAKKRLDATDWAAGIAEQYATGDVAGAADRLRAFRAVDPEADQYLPDTLRAWARSVE